MSLRLMSRPAAVVLINGDGWEQLLNEYKDSGLFRHTFNSVVKFQEALCSLVLANPANMELGSL